MGRLVDFGVIMACRKRPLAGRPVLQVQSLERPFLQGCDRREVCQTFVGVIGTRTALSGLRTARSQVHIPRPVRLRRDDWELWMREGMRKR